MKIEDRTAKSCMTKSKITDYVINPYLGCEHNCLYCYATFMKRFQNIKEEWGTFCYPKINCPDLLPAELKRNKPGTIWLSSVTDPYTPLEGKMKITRKILEIIAASPYKNKFKIEILTKSALVKRDFDILKKLNVELGVSVNNLSAKVARVIEPVASPPKERIMTLREAHERGLKTYGFISPVLPGITNLDEIFRELNFVDYVYVELLNTYPTSMNRLMPEIRKHFPEGLKDFDFMMNHFDDYSQNLKEEVKNLERKYKVKVKSVIIHNEKKY